MIRRAARVVRSLQIILILYACIRRIELVKNSLHRILVGVQEQIIEQRRHSVVGDVVGGELLDLVLRGAVYDADVAVGTGEALVRGVRVDAHGEGEVDLAEAIVFVVAGWVAEVAGGWGGENQVW